MLSDLAAYPVGTIESGVAKLGRRPRGEGVAAPGLSPLRRLRGTLVGYAVTVEVSVDKNEQHGRRETADWWKSIEKQSATPRIVLAQDISSIPAEGVACGRLSAHIYAALGCKGLLTNGYVRDADSLDSLDFALFAKGRSARHGNPHIVRFGGPVEVNGMRAEPGNLVAADADGAIAFPAEWLNDVIAQIRALESSQTAIFTHLRSGKADAASIANVLAPSPKR